MWFDVQAALAEIEGGQSTAPEAATLATLATTATIPARVANVASVATPPALENEAEASEAMPSVANVADVATPETFPHGASVAGTPLTWTGRVVSIEAWRRLSEWDRHGPKGRNWSGVAKVWEWSK
ncbi:hypothetical protein AB9K41_23730 [Cribrihabitans sp. XS_ASV171]